MNTLLMTKAQGKEFQSVEFNSQHVFVLGRNILINDMVLAMEHLAFELYEAVR